MKHKRIKKFKTKKEPSMFWKIIQVFWLRHKERKAFKTLETQVWSADFLSYIAYKSAKYIGTPMEITVEAPNGAKLKFRSMNASEYIKESIDDSILDHLDDTQAVNEFIAKHSVR